MLHMIKVGIAAGVLSLAFPFNGFAADKAGPAPVVAAVQEEAPAFGGAPSCYVQALAGASIDVVDVDVLPTSLSASGWTVALGAGCDVRLNRFVVGAFVRGSLPVDTEGRILDEDYSYLVAARAGYLLNTGLLAYGVIGFHGSELGSPLLDINTNGLALGGGLEIKLTDHTSLTAEYLQTGYGKQHDMGVTVEPVNHSFRMGLSYRFGGLFQ